MQAFRLLLIAMFIALSAYTAVTIFNHGMGIIPAFFENMAEMTWSGQFNADFMGFLMLSGLWLSWRHHFTPVGLLLGVCGFFGGIMFLAPYLFIASLQANGDMKELMLGKVRASRA